MDNVRRLNFLKQGAAGFQIRQITVFRTQKHKLLIGTSVGSITGYLNLTNKNILY